MKPIAKLFGSVSVCLLTGFVGSFSTMDSVSTWYADLSKPLFNPPDWAFGVVWPILYVMMAVAALLIWKRGIRHRQIKVALGLFVFQLVLTRISHRCWFLDGIEAVWGSVQGTKGHA